MPRQITFYRVETDVDTFQSFMFEDVKLLDVDSGRYYFDGRPKERWVPPRRWKPPKVFSYTPLLPEPDFWGFGAGAAGAVFAVGPPVLAHAAVREYLESVGELLPLPYDGREFAVVNITTCIAALDEDSSEWYYHEDGSRYRVRTPAFRLDRLGPSLFKMPETGGLDIYCWEDAQDAENQFKGTVERSGLTGLVFTKMYDVRR